MRVELSAIIAAFLIIAPASLLYWDMDGDGLKSYEEIFGDTDYNNPDTDADRLTDYDEINIYKTDPTLTDTDGDGLDDYEEYNTWHTDQLVADTDGDGLLLSLIHI